MKFPIYYLYVFDIYDIFKSIYVYIYGIIKYLYNFDVYDIFYLNFCHFKRKKKCVSSELK